VRVLVCGGRDFHDRGRVHHALDAFHARKGPVTVVIQGGARGADAHAASWALERDIVSLTFPADWKQHGKSAGWIRNQLMLEKGEPDVVIAFPGGSGTGDMVRRAEKAGLTVYRIEPSPTQQLLLEMEG
jgi:hypothetical protein